MEGERNQTLVAALKLLLTGIRKEEAMQAQWVNVDLERRRRARSRVKFADIHQRLVTGMLGGESIRLHLLLQFTLCQKGVCINTPYIKSLTNLSE